MFRSFLLLAALVLCLPVSTEACDGATPVVAAELAALIENDGAPVILDVRTDEEFAAGHVPGAVHLPHDEIETRGESLPDDRETEIVVYSLNGDRAYIAVTHLRAVGYSHVIMLEGHWLWWQEAGRPVER